MLLPSHASCVDLRMARRLYPRLQECTIAPTTSSKLTRTRRHHGEPSYSNKIRRGEGGGPLRGAATLPRPWRSHTARRAVSSPRICEKNARGFGPLEVRLFYAPPRAVARVSITHGERREGESSSYHRSYAKIFRKISPLCPSAEVTARAADDRWSLRSCWRNGRPPTGRCRLPAA